MSLWSPSTPAPSSSLLLVDDDESRLLSELLPLPDASNVSSYSQNTGPGGADLSLSELSLTDRPPIHDGPRFSLLAPQPVPSRPHSPDQNAIAEDEEDAQGAETSIETQDDPANMTVLARAVATKTRGEKLQHDLFILKKLNASFATLSDALSTAKTATEQVVEQLEQTDALLDKYANMLAKSEGVARLLFDERWQGADADEETVARERAEALERARLEREREREEAARREAEERARQEAEEAARREAEERAQQEAAAASVSTKSAPRGRSAVTGVGVGSGVRGVRGTRATAAAAVAMRSGGGRGVSRGTGGVGGGIPRPSSVVGRGAGGSVLPRGVSRRG